MRGGSASGVHWGAGWHAQKRCAHTSSSAAANSNPTAACGFMGAHPKRTFMGGLYLRRRSDGTTPACISRMIPAFLFDDKRWTTGLLVAWSTLSLLVFLGLGVLHGQFFRFGPSETLHFMTVAIDTWTEWTLLSLYCCVDTLIRSFGDDALAPWITNVIADPKTASLPYTRCTCIAIIEIYTAYLHLSNIFHFFLSFTQFDFVLIKMASDMLMKVYTYGAYMGRKRPYAPMASDAPVTVIV